MQQFTGQKIVQQVPSASKLAHGTITYSQAASRIAPSHAASQRLSHCPKLASNANLNRQKQASITINGKVVPTGPRADNTTRSCAQTIRLPAILTPSSPVDQASGHKRKAAEGISDRGGSLAGSKAPTIQARTDLGEINSRPDDYRHGDIVFFPHVVPSLDPSAVFGYNVVEAQSVGTICAKFRPAIVTHIYEGHLTVAPIYSSAGRGLSKKPSEYRSHCVPIIRPGDPKPETSADITKDVFLAGGQSLSSGTYVRLPELCCVEYGWPIKKTGFLDDKSTAAMVYKLKMLFEKGLAPIAMQDNWSDRYEKMLKQRQEAMQLLRSKQVQTSRSIAAFNAAETRADSISGWSTVSYYNRPHVAKPKA